MTGLADFLRGKESVTKNEIASWLESNRVQLGQATNEGRGGWYAGDYDAYAGDASSLGELMDGSGRNDTGSWEFSRGYVSGHLEGDDDAFHDIMITKHFDISDRTAVGEVLDEVDLQIRNDEYYMAPENAGTLEEIQYVLGRLRTKLREEPGAWRGDNQEIDELFNELDELAPGRVFDAMDARAQYEVYDPSDHYAIATVNDETEALHRARNYIETLDAPDHQAVAGYSDVTFPTASGEKPPNYKVIRMLMPEDDPRFPAIGGNAADVYQHFEKNTYAHFRSSDRHFVTLSGDPDLFGDYKWSESIRGMFVEEIQSDLMQAGGQKGWKTKELTQANVLEAQAAVQNNLKSKLAAFGYDQPIDGSPVSASGEPRRRNWRPEQIVNNLAGLYTGFERMVRDKDRVKAMTEYLHDKFNLTGKVTFDPERGWINPDGTRAASITSVKETDPSNREVALVESIERIIETIAELPDKKATDDQIYTAFQYFVAELHGLRPNIDDLGGAVRDMSPKRYRSSAGHHTARLGDVGHVAFEDYDLGLEMLQKLDAKDLREVFRAGDMQAIFEGGIPDVPMKKNWVETTIKRAIAEGLKDGHNVIAFPNHAETVGAIEYGGRPAEGPIKRLYEEQIPKLLKKIAKQYGGTVEIGAIADSNRAAAGSVEAAGASQNKSRPNSGSVIILRLSSEEGRRIQHEGLALPSAIVGGALGAREVQRRRSSEEKQAKPAVI